MGGQRSNEPDGGPSGNRERAGLLLGGLAIAAAVALSAFSDEGTRDGCDARVNGEFATGQWPRACWRPYSDRSPFNHRLPLDAPPAPDSDRVVGDLLAGGPIGAIVVGDPDRDFGSPTYWPDSDDPEVELHCTKPWGRCELEGLKVRIPESATPAGRFPDEPGGRDWDNHMTIVDQSDGWEYDLWNVDRPPDSGVLSFAYGGRTKLDGDGLGSDGVAARYGNLAGAIRGQELTAGQINHALALNVPCTVGFVYPASKGGFECDQAGLERSAPPMGALFRLDVSEREIRALRLPPWKEAIAVALRRYGAYVSDTTGEPDQWSLEVESGATYESFGVEDPMVGLARTLGIPERDYDGNGQGELWFVLDGGIDWRRLQVIDPCVSLGPSC